jgi:hypothetical protein
MTTMANQMSALTGGVGIEDLAGMSQEQLDVLFKASPAGEIPDGSAEGMAIVGHGGFWRKFFSKMVRRWLWQGKVFSAGKGRLINRVSLLSIRAIVAQVYKGDSWLDGKPCIVLDYSKTSLVARKIRDEIRQVGPSVYLGKVYWGKKRLLDFALLFPGEVAGNISTRGRPAAQALEAS